MENKVDINLELKDYEEIIEKLENIKKLLQEIADTKIQIEVK